jgi:hypothetical protein
MVVIWQRIHGNPLPRKAIEQEIASCIICKMGRNITKKTPGPMIAFKQSDFSHQNLHIDIARPITGSASRFLTVIVDRFLRYIWSFPTQLTPKAIEILQLIHEAIKIPQGTIREIVTDQATQFTSKVRKEIMDEQRIKHKSGSVFNSQIDGLAESCIKKINDKIRNYLIQFPEQDWALALPIITRAINITPNQTTKTAPFKTIYSFYLKSDFNVIKKMKDQEILMRQIQENTTKTIQQMKQQTIKTKKYQNRGI